MAYDLEEQEQLAQLKAWWDKYGTITLGLLSLVLVTVLGWQGLNWYENNQAQQARGYYEALERAAAEPADQNSAARIEAAVQTLQSDFAATDYAARAALLASDALREANQLSQAEQPLRWLANSQHVALAPVAKLRLAGLLLDQQQYDQALAVLDTPPESFAALYADRRGDVLAAQGKRDEAVAAWRQAIDGLPASGTLRNVLQLKIDTLGS